MKKVLFLLVFCLGSPLSAQQITYTPNGAVAAIDGIPVLYPAQPVLVPVVRLTPVARFIPVVPVVPVVPVIPVVPVAPAQRVPARYVPRVQYTPRVQYAPRVPQASSGASCPT